MKGVLIMSSISDRVIARNGDIFSIKRNESVVADTKGFFTDKNYPNGIQLLSTSDIKVNDVLIHNLTGESYMIERIQPLTRANELLGYIAYYKVNTASNDTQTFQYNIGTIQGSAVVGNQQNVTLNIGSSIEEIKSLISAKPIEDQEELNKLIQRFENVIEDNQPISKGFFSKFSDVLKKHSDIAIALGENIIDWLTNR
ncbi:hypothetical protein Clole_0788 [Cellulosilyticum lentocellum DSM 5427]|uniref:Uncharacterized protein n=2 Tax=Cellulosilyticum lentocellum TaxID=29360 RepID=F2JPH3_CELLD|nr:hypothetical protein Clole_0788 [Cellulosilyticum lentocellum DSM 5427]